MAGRNRAGLIAVLLGVALAAARGGEGRWPIPPVPENAYSVVRPDENPLVREGSKVVPPAIVWEKLTVRPDHPRLIFTKENRKALRERLRDHPALPLLEKAQEDGDPLASAFLFQLSGEAEHARTAIRALIEGRVKPYEAPYVYDWAYDKMTAAEREEATERLWATVALDRSSGWPRCSPYTGYPSDPRPSETPPARWAPFYNWTFHDQDWARIHAPTFAALIAMAGHRPRAAEGVRNYWEYSLKDAALFLDYLRDGSYWQGYYWWITEKVQRMVSIFDHVHTACGIDYTDPSKHPYLGNCGRWILYCSDPWRKRMIYNYGDGEVAPIEVRTRLCALAANSLARDPYVKWFLQKACPPPAQWLPELLYDDPRVLPKEPNPDDLPPARAFPGTGFVVMRSGWRANDVWAAVRWADWFDIHCHGDVGSFTLYCKSYLAPDAGHYCPGVYHYNHYFRRTISHNTITVRDPAVKAGLNDGCQQLAEKRVWSFAVGTAAWLYNQPDFDRGDLLAFRHHKLYDYCAGSGARAYRSEHLQEFIRQFVFLRDNVVLVFDRVETTRPDLEARWLMHLVGEPRVDGKLLRAQVKGHIEDYEGSLSVSRATGGAVLRCHTLLPAKRIIRRIGGAIPKIPISTLVRVPRTRHRMGTGSRWLWTDPLILYYHDPLTGKKLPALCFERDNPTDVEYEVSETELYMKIDAYERGRVTELRFALDDFPTILELAREMGRRAIWHLPVHYLPGYEYYNEGMNYAPAYGKDEWNHPDRFAPEMTGGPNEHGGWRIEVLPTQRTKRHYFFNVIRVQTTEEDEPGSVRLRDSAASAQATIVLGGRIYTVSFAKTGDVGGHMRITDTEGKVLVDRDFARKIEQKEWGAP